MKFRRVGDPASKYAYDRCLDTDIQDKKQKSAELKARAQLLITELFNEPIYYIDGEAMSRENKWMCIQAALREFYQRFIE